MRIIETCPKCGGDLVDLVIATDPPIPQKKCFNCGWEWTGEREEVVRVPFGGNTYTNGTDTVTISSNDYIKAPVTIPEVAWNGNTYTNTTDTRTISWTDHFKKSVSMPEVTLNGGVDCHIVERYEPIQPSKVRYVPYQPSDTDYNNLPCKYCSNNPENGGSGVCNCTLGRRIDIL